MKKLALTLALVVATSVASAKLINSACHGDSFEFTGDKQSHLLWSAGIGAATAAVIDDPWVAFGVSLLPGFYREGWRGPCFSGQDMVYNMIGASIGVSGYNVIIAPNFIGVKIPL